MIYRNKPSDTQRTKKVSLPAALFNRSPLKNSENSSLISNSNIHNTGDKFCYNHPAKKGKYLVITEEEEEDDEIIYCEKCAILLASRGFEVKKIGVEASKVSKSSEKNSNREYELNSFLEELEDKLGGLKASQKQANFILENIEEKQDQENQRIQEFFNQLISLIEKKKNMLVYSNSLKNKSLYDDAQRDIKSISEGIQSLQNIKEDIVNSLQSIIKDTPNEDYNLVMSHYSKVLSEMKTEYEAITNSKLVLPGLQQTQETLDKIFGESSNPFFSFDSSKNNAYE